MFCTVLVSKPVILSPALADFLKVESIPRSEVSKLLWVYIKENNLQNPKDKREILCDEKLEVLFKRKKMNCFKMTKYLSDVSNNNEFKFHSL